VRRLAWWVAWRAVQAAGWALHRVGHRLAGTGLRLAQRSVYAGKTADRCRCGWQGQTADAPRGEAEEGGGAPPGGF